MFMKIIITESQLTKLYKIINEQDLKEISVDIKKFRRSDNIDYGKYGKVIEKLTHQYFKSVSLDNGICDIICLKMPNDDTYILMVLMNQYINEYNLQKYINSFIPKDIMLIVNVNYHCGDSK
jgi:hypothetical protein